MSSDSITYRGRAYSIRGKCKYYACRASRDGTRLLHRHVWIDHNGAIPAGHVIHHRDHDIHNNDISNLEALPTKKHSADHLNERIAKGEMPPPSRATLEKAALWHASPAGKAWHSAKAKKQWESATTQTKVCECCGKSYEAHMSNARYCSNPCIQRASYHKQFTETKRCDFCGTEFVSSKYRATKHCSRICAIRNRAKAASQ